MKLEFGYLETKQAWRLFREECKLLSLPIKEKQRLKKQLALLGTLTPGDFAAVKRQNRFRPIKSVESFVERLREEVAVKEEGLGGKMGFL
jgi:hypothetical protein